MGLADLKKQSSYKPLFRPKLVAVEDFIEDANHYAMGLTRPLFTEKSELQTSKDKSLCKRKNATFSLNDKVIEQLNELSRETGVFKSVLVRALVKHIYKLDSSEREAVLRQNTQN